MLSRPQASGRRRLCGIVASVLAAAAALGATASHAGSAIGEQVRTIIVWPDGAGSYRLVIGGVDVAPGAPLLDGATLPADFRQSTTEGCNLTARAAPMAMVLKGDAGIASYTIACGSAASTTVQAAIAEGLASMATLRKNVAGQHQPSFPESERRYALGVIDESIRALKEDVARTR